MAIAIGRGGLFSAIPAKADETDSNLIQDNPGIVVQDGSALVNDANISDDVVTDNATLDDLSTEYNLKDVNISECPEGTPVLKFDSVEDLNKFLATEDAAPKTIETTINNTEPLPVSKLGLSQPLASRSSNYTTVRKTKTVNTGFANVNLKADIRVYSSGSFREIKSCHEWTDHTGFTFSLDWDEKYHWHKISKDHSSVTVAGGGVLNYVIFVSGIGKMYSRPIDIKFTYKL